MLVIQVIIAVILLGVIVFTIVRLYSNDPQISQNILFQKYSHWELLLNVFIPAILHIIVSVTAAILLRYFYRSQTGIEAQLLPAILLATTMGYVMILPWYTFVSTSIIFSAPTISAIYHFSLLFVALGYMGCALMHNQSMNFNQTQFLMIAFLFSLFPVSIAPITSNSLQEPLVTRMMNNMFSIVLLVIEVLAVITFMIDLVKENNAHERLRDLSFILMTIGNSLQSAYFSTAFNAIGIVLFTGGTIMLISLTRTYQVWG